MKNVWQVLVLAGVLMGSAVSAMAQVSDHDRLWVQNYKDLSVQAYVQIAKRPSNGLLNITNEDIRTKAELRLRRAGIPPMDVAPQELFITLHIIGPAAAIQVSFYRTTSWNLPNGEIVEYVLSTWTTDWVELHGDDRASLLSSIEDGVDRFLNAYLKANQDGGQ